jgi:uncharacterized protein (TIGR02996 family)
MDADTFLSAIHDDPAEEATWLALADWLEENGRSAQAEFLRLHRAVRPGPTAPRFDANRTRLQAMLKAKVVPCVPTIANSLGMRLALIPAGEFVMGSPPGETGHEQTESPPHPVEIGRPFYLGIYPVTQAEFRKLLRRNPSEFREGGDNGSTVAGIETSDFPVENVTWDAAVRFCQRLSERPEEKKADRIYRLPTEAEWEYACRGWLGEGPFYLGKTVSSRLVNYRGSQPYRGSRKGPNLCRPCPVGEYPPNPFGLYDLHGQVWEWCSDLFDPGYYARSPSKDPAGPATNADGDRVQRGGCWGAIGACCRSASRTSDDPAGAQYCFGFRVALSWGKG